MKLSYEDYMVSLLRPLGAYDLGSGTINRGELAAYGLSLIHISEPTRLL